MAEAAVILPETDIKHSLAVLQERPYDERSALGLIARELSGTSKPEQTLASPIPRIFLTRVRGETPKNEDRQAFDTLIDKGLGTLDPETRFLAALTAREEGGKIWAKTHESLKESLIAQGTRSEGTFTIGNDPLSTAWAIAALQVPYRYLRCIGNKL
jgi:hypothetical protein